VEPTSGNTGIALAALAALEGVRLTVTIPSGAPQEKLTILRMLGATVMTTPDDLCPTDNPGDGAIALARAVAERRARILVVTDVIAEAMRTEVNAVRAAAAWPLVVEVPGPTGPMPGKRSLLAPIQEAVGVRV